MFNSRRKCQMVFQSGRTIWHPHQQYMRAPAVPHLPQHCVLALFFIFAISIGAQSFHFASPKWLMILEHLFMCTFAICPSSWFKHLFDSFKNCFLSYQLWRILKEILWIQVPHTCFVLKFFWDTPAFRADAQREVLGWWTRILELNLERALIGV